MLLCINNWLAAGTTVRRGKRYNKWATVWRLPEAPVTGVQREQCLGVVEYNEIVEDCVGQCKGHRDASPHRDAYDLIYFAVGETRYVVR